MTDETAEWQEAIERAVEALNRLNELLHPERLVYDVKPTPSMAKRARALMMTTPEMGLLEALAVAEAEEERGDVPGDGA